MKTIKTKYLGPTTHLGSRIKATSSGGESVTISYDYSLNHISDVHKKAVIALAEELIWDGKMIGGHLGDDTMAWVFMEDTMVELKKINENNA